MFLTHLLPEPDQVDLRATATTSQRLAEGTRCSAEAQATATPLPAYVVKFRSVFAKEDFDILPVMGINRFDHETKVNARSERQNLQAASQLCTKQVGTGEINQIIESLLKIKVQRITKTYQIET